VLLGGVTSEQRPEWSQGVNHLFNDAILGEGKPGSGQQVQRPPGAAKRPAPGVQRVNKEEKGKAQTAEGCHGSCGPVLSLLGVSRAQHEGRGMAPVSFHPVYLMVSWCLRFQILLVTQVIISMEGHIQFQFYLGNAW
jgi:hypothetical protein